MGKPNAAAPPLRPTRFDFGRGAKAPSPHAAKRNGGGTVRGWSLGRSHRALLPKSLTVPLPLAGGGGGLGAEFRIEALRLRAGPVYPALLRARERWDGTNPALSAC